MAAHNHLDFIPSQGRQSDPTNLGHQIPIWLADLVAVKREHKLHLAIERGVVIIKFD